jgi:hypothetical protein
VGWFPFTGHARRGRGAGGKAVVNQNKKKRYQIWYQLPDRTVVKKEKPYCGYSLASVGITIGVYSNLNKHLLDSRILDYGGEEVVDSQDPEMEKDEEEEED